MEKTGKDGGSTTQVVTKNRLFLKHARGGRTGEDRREKKKRERGSYIP
jgi:hypothetical protein